MNGVGEDRFAPEGEITRAMAVTVLWRAAGEPESGAAAGFRDVDPGAWYARAVDWAAENGIVTGQSDTLFAPDDPVTREQLAAMLRRGFLLAVPQMPGEAEVNVSIAQALGADVPEGTGEGETALPFAGAGSVSDWAAEDLRWAWDAGILSGVADQLMNPQGVATRAEAADMLLRMTALPRA